MSTAAVSKSTYDGPLVRVVAPNGHPKMQIIAQGGVAFVVPFAPRDHTLDNVVPVWDTVARGGRAPLLVRGGGQLEQLSYELVLGNPDPDDPIEDELEMLRNVAKSGARMRVALDRSTSGKRWRMTAYSQQVTSRAFGTNQATRAIVSMTLTEASDSVVAVGPVSGGAEGDGDKERPNFYKVQQGDTLRSIAVKFYNGNANKAGAIADANKIRDPKSIRPGDRLRLP